MNVALFLPNSVNIAPEWFMVNNQSISNNSGTGTGGVFFSFAGPPVNVTCNIFINSFGSIAETTMVRYFNSVNV